MSEPFVLLAFMLYNKTYQTSADICMQVEIFLSLISSVQIQSNNLNSAITCKVNCNRSLQNHNTCIELKSAFYIAYYKGSCLTDGCT